MDANAFDIRSEIPAATDSAPVVVRGRPQAPTFRVKNGAHVRAHDASLLAAVMSRLVAEDRGTAAELVREARPTQSPIHHCFEWDDAKAAELHRLRQAGKYWGAIELTILAEDSTEKRQRAFHPVFVDGDRVYQSIGTIAQNESLLDQLVAQAKKDLIAFKHRYQTLREARELEGVFAAISALEGS